MFIDIDDTVIDDIMERKIKQNIVDFQEMIDEMQETGTTTGMFSHDVDEDIVAISKLLAGAKEYYKWYKSS